MKDGARLGRPGGRCFEVRTSIAAGQRSFAEVADGGNVFDLREEPDGGFTALTGAGAYRFDRDGQLVEEVRFVREDLFRTRFLPVGTGPGPYLGWGRGSLSFLSVDSQLRASLPSTWSFTVGDVGADGGIDRLPLRRRPGATMPARPEQAGRGRGEAGVGSGMALSAAPFDQVSGGVLGTAAGR